MTASNLEVVPADRRSNWLSLLEVSVREVFEIMVGSNLHAVPPDQTLPRLEFTAMVGLAGRICGVLTLCTTAHSAALMASKMLGIEPQEADPQTWDAIGEVCNMIAGNFKNKLPGGSEPCLLSVPTVISGGDYNFHSLSDGDRLQTILAFDGVPIVVSLELHT